MLFYDRANLIAAWRSDETSSFPVCLFLSDPYLLNSALLVVLFQCATNHSFSWVGRFRCALGVGVGGSQNSGEMSLSVQLHG